MSTLKVNTLQNASGVEVYTAKAWVNFNGTGTVAIRAAGNVSSITDNGVGDYTVNFTTAMPDANYEISGALGVSTSSGPMIIGVFAAGAAGTYQAPTATAFRVQTRQSISQALEDISTVSMSIFR